MAICHVWSHYNCHVTTLLRTLIGPSGWGFLGSPAHRLHPQTTPKVSHPITAGTSDNLS
ncbi:hypothetical protein X777_01720 [Ooceraea biroi]|uniref:Uncharacterized protein n=1 Tax=Ooceraea biroi TaxID=2015173 RepID=A0A026WPW5_OOCBI|nr:hypothetical protein X777_01720 [Ooceraea biroi]